MLAAINFNNHLLFQTNKVNDVNSDGMLSSKFEIFEVAIAEEIPDTLLRFRRVCTELLWSGF